MNTIAQSKYFRLIKTFTLEDQKSYESWLNSPWCNTNKTLIRLFEKVKKYYPNFDDPKLTKEKLFKKILPNGKYSDRRMNNILSEGYLAAERFITFQNLSKDQNLQKDLLQKEFQNRHLEEWFFRDINKEIERVEEIEIKEWEDHLHLFQMHRRVYHHPNQKLRMRLGSNSILNMGHSIDIIFLMEKAYILQEKMIRSRILKNENYEIEIELEEWFKISGRINHPSIELYKLRLKNKNENIAEEYLEFKEVFFKKFEALNKNEQRIHLMAVINETGKLSRARYIEVSELLPLYQLGLRTKLLFNQGKLTHITYYSIIMSSNVQKAFDFTLEVIENYTKHLKKEYQNDAKIWALAHTSYRKMNLDNAINFLISHEFKTYFFNLASRLLTTQAYFDLYLRDENYQFYLFNYFDSFEKWLTRTKIHSKSVQQSFTKFVQICRKLAKEYSDVNFDLNKISELLKDEKNVQAPKWLGQKIEEILLLKQKS